METRKRLLKNAVANVCRGGAMGIVALLLPPVLVRHMTAVAYGVWVLVLQTSAYVGYLDFGLQTAVGRYIAFANEKSDVELRDSIFSTAFAGLMMAGILSFLLLAVAAALVQKIFPSIPPDLISTMRTMLLIVGGSLAIGLPASAWNGVFIGLQRNEIPAFTVGGGKILSAAGLIAVVLTRNSLTEMAYVVAISNLLSYGAQYYALREIAPGIRFARRVIHRAAARELLDYCFALTVMSFSMLLITGFDLILVGRFQFSEVVPYSVAAGAIPFLSGSLFAVMNAMMPHAATLHAQNKSREMGDLVLSSTRISMLLLIFTGCPVLIYAGPILKLWIGAKFVATGTLILIVLTIANMVRLIGAGYAVVLVAAGQQRLIKVSPLSEGVGNLLASICLGMTMGAIGVAIGTLVGSFISIGAHLVYSMPRTWEQIRLSRRRYLSSAVGVPILCTFPLSLAAGFSIAGIHITAWEFVLALTTSLMGGFWLLYRSGTLAMNR